VTFRVKNNVLWLEIAVNYSVSVETLESKDDFCGVKSCSLIVKLQFLPQMKEQLTSVEEIDHEVQSLWRLESVVQLHDKRVVDAFQNHPLH